MMFHRVCFVQVLLFDFLSKEILSEEVNELSASIRSMVPRSDREDLIQLFKSLTFRLRNEEENSSKANEVPNSVPSESPLRFESFQQGRPRDCKNKVEEPSRGCGERHSLSSNV